ncbi:MAG: hypothetical protein KatS3mg111_0327 [Pirellulaceae bacterium]|nr:MAG: hypothetical protein KatS3mg111_0327 [Pirellulaceae bacterium]
MGCNALFFRSGPVRRWIYQVGVLATLLWIGPVLVLAQPPEAEQSPRLVAPRGEDGDGSVAVSGELRQWHKITLTLDGPFAHERDRDPNPFTDYALEVIFLHGSGVRYEVPGYFAADGQAADTGAEAGTKWRVHFTPDRTGTWRYQVRMRRGRDVAIGGMGDHLVAFESEGQFAVTTSDKKAPDFRARGRLQYVGQHYLRFAGSGEYFLKAGPDAPETLLAYADFDNTVARKKNAPLKQWEAHIRDWRNGDPTWKGGQGKGLIGAINYLAEKGCNSISFLPYNAGGDGDNVWPFVEREDKEHYDCSKLDQWGIVLDHATERGLFLHFKLQETENDDQRIGGGSKTGDVPASLDGGKLGRHRKLYLRELIARFGHALALNWNLGEENTQSPEEQREMARYILDTDPYDSPIVIHTYPSQQDKVYTPLLGDQSVLAGASLQNPWNEAHARTRQWREASARAGRPWVVCNDEQNPAALGVPPDPGYAGHSGIAETDDMRYDLHDIRKHCLWGTLLAGGGGVEYYFGYQLPQNDLNCEDFRSRDRSWDYCRIALQFFRDHAIPITDMKCLDELLSSSKNYCFGKPGALYLVYLPEGGTCGLAVSHSDQYRLQWFNPREGGELVDGEVTVELGEVHFAAPDENDWLAVLRRHKN